MKVEKAAGISFILIAIVLFFISGFMVLMMNALGNAAASLAALGGAAMTQGLTNLIMIGWAFTVFAILAGISSIVTGIWQLVSK